MVDLVYQWYIVGRSEMMGEGRGSLGRIVPEAGHVGKSGDVLSEKEKALAEHYAETLNYARAYQLAGYLTAEQSTDRQNAQKARKILSRAIVARYVDHLLEQQVMSKMEILSRLGEQARAEYGAYITENGWIDLTAMKRDGVMHLIKSIKHTKEGMNVEFHDPQKAKELLGKYHKLWTERTEQSGEVTVRVVYDEPLETDEPTE